MNPNAKKKNTHQKHNLANPTRDPKPNCKIKMVYHTPSIQTTSDKHELKKFNHIF
jgi:hypothetical protein